MATSSIKIFLFIPNLLGYVRIILAILSFYCMLYAPGRAIALYLISELMDALDGYTARKFKQSSSFGSVLDMVTDRMSTLGLLMVLACFYPDHIIVYQFIAILDITSHWLQMYSSLISGKSSHKGSGNALLNIYYSSKIILFVVHGGNELFLIGTYLQYFSVGPLVNIFGYYKGCWELISFFSLPFFLTKQIAHIIQLITASQELAMYDIKRSSLAIN